VPGRLALYLRQGLQPMPERQGAIGGGENYQKAERDFNIMDSLLVSFLPLCGVIIFCF